MFSKRHKFATTPPVQFRHDAPEGMRHAVVQAAYEHLTYERIRTSMCGTLYLAPDKGNWSEIPNIRDEVEYIIQAAEWYRVYDVIEGLVANIEKSYDCDRAEKFVLRLNSIFVDTGAGWQYVEGEGVVIRGDADFEDVVHSSKEALSETGFAARYVSGSNEDLGRLASRIGLPPPLDEALKKMWGFSSNFGRHVSPTKIPTQDEAQLIVHLSSAYCRYLADCKK